MVRLDELRIERFRGILKGHVREFADMNLFIGRNNAGKSTVAEAITRVVSSATGVKRDPLGRNTVEIWNHMRATGTHAPECWYKQDLSQHVVLEAKLGKTVIRLRLIASDSGMGEQREIEGDLTDRARHYSEGVSVFLPADASNRNIETTLWPRLLSRRQDKALTRALNDIFGMDVEQLQVLPDQRLVLLFPDHSLPLDVQGDGTRSALRCLMLLSALRDTGFLLEEPESHQHPGSLGRFAKAIATQAREQQVQLFISTHSEECVRAFLNAAGEARAEAAVFYLKLESGVLEATRLTPEAVQTLQTTGVDVRFLELYA